MIEQMPGEAISFRRYYFRNEYLLERARAIFEKPLHEREEAERLLLEWTLPVSVNAVREVIRLADIDFAANQDIGAFGNKLWNSAVVIKNNLTETTSGGVPSSGAMHERSGWTDILNFIAAHQQEMSHAAVLDRDRQIVVESVLELASKLCLISTDIHIPTVAGEVVGLANEAERIFIDQQQRLRSG